jgi:hypothetical protein
MTHKQFTLLFFLLMAVVISIGCKQAQSENPQKTQSWNHADWSNHLKEIIHNEWDSFEQAIDVEIVCHKYSTLVLKEQQEVILELIIAIAFYESGWNPLSRYHEKTMGIDPVTKKPVYSEGLLQLSYQDTQWARYCEFDWNKDKHLAENDPAKTILDPFKNLSCGAKILANQIARKKKIFVSSGAYWAVIKEGGRYEKISEIKSRVLSSLPNCR